MVADLMCLGMEAWNYKHHSTTDSIHRREGKESRVKEADLQELFYWLGCEKS
jgi:hypothetical protein